VKRRFVILLLILSFVSGLAVNNIHTAWVSVHALVTPASIDFITLADSIGWANQSWQQEIARRFPDAIVIACHGGDDDNGTWTLYPDKFDPLLSLFTDNPVFHPLPTMPVEDYVANIQKLRPGREIVLLVCNPEHHTLKLKGVAYAMDSVWTIPDRAQLPRTTLDPKAAGNIFEFVSQ
jgi:hypothetical protein